MGVEPIPRFSRERILSPRNLRGASNATSINFPNQLLPVTVCAATSFEPGPAEIIAFWPRKISLEHLARALTYPFGPPSAGDRQRPDTVRSTLGRSNRRASV